MQLQTAMLLFSSFLYICNMKLKVFEDAYILNAVS